VNRLGTWEKTIPNEVFSSPPLFWHGQIVKELLKRKRKKSDDAEL
jgi:hypothetical protein